MSPAAIYEDLPPGIKFVPTDQQIVELYLMPRIRGQPDLIPELVIDDDTAANTQPWKLFGRHGLERQRDGAPAFFFVRVNDARPGARPERACDGGGKWKSMKSEREQVLKLVEGEEINYTRHNLNFQMGEGSIGWVMHEYTVTDHPSLRICGISFSGHCKKRMRAPDDCLAAGEPATQRPRLAAAHDDSASGIPEAAFVHQAIGAAQDVEDQPSDSASATCAASGSSTTAFVQDISAVQDCEEPMPIFSYEEMAQMMNNLEPLFEDMGTTMEQKLDQDAVPLQHMDIMATGGGGQGTMITWEGFEFDLT
ncbi:hypothetical protein QOZ80_2BG0163740 [Eleusine coracana subsp. coracana]|nr:hypothetical protein QOZ80_2BG0163740 [Eleusine coracana subsp. coracana]